LEASSGLSMMRSEPRKRKRKRSKGIRLCVTAVVELIRQSPKNRAQEMEYFMAASDYLPKNSRDVVMCGGAIGAWEGLKYLTVKGYQKAKEYLEEEEDGDEDVKEKKHSRTGTRG
jgi:hypothetical protein